MVHKHREILNNRNAIFSLCEASCEAQFKPDVTSFFVGWFQESSAPPLGYKNKKYINNNNNTNTKQDSVKSQQLFKLRRGRLFRLLFCAGVQPCDSLHAFNDRTKYEKIEGRQKGYQQPRSPGLSSHPYDLRSLCGVVRWETLGTFP